MGDFNFEAANQGAVAVPNAVNASIDAWDKINQNARVADMMVKANPDLVQRMGFQSPSQFSNLSAQDKIAATTGYIRKQGYDQAQAQIQEQLARANQFNAIAQERQQQAMDDQDSSSMLKKLDQYVNGGTGDDGKPLPADSPYVAAAANLTPLQKLNIHAGAANTANSPRLASQIYKSVQSYFSDPEATKKPFFSTGDVQSPMPVGYKRIVTGPNESQVVVDPTTAGPMQANGFYYDGKRWVSASGQTIKPGEALQTYNKNGARMGEISTQLKMAQDPQYNGIYDPDALNKEMDDLKVQQSTLKPIWQGNGAAPGGAPEKKQTTAPAAAAVNPDDVKWLMQKPTPQRIAQFESTYGKGASDQYLP